LTNVWEVTSGLTLGDVLRTWAGRDPTRRFCRFDDGAWRSYGDLWAGAARLATALRSMGLAPLDRVVVIMGKRFDYLEAMFGIMQAGCVYVPANSEYSADQLQMVLEDCTPNVVLCDNEFTKVVLEAVAATGATGARVVSVDPPSDGGVLSLADHLDPSVTDAPSDARTEDPALIMYTSGTTGRPKGVTFSHGNVMCEAVMKGHAKDPEGIGLDFFPLHHFNGGFGQIIPPLYHGGAVVLQREFDPVDFGAQLARFGVTHSAVNSNHVYALLAEPPRENDAKHPCTWMTLGLKVDAETHLAFENRYHTRLLGVYGVTEAVGPFIQEDLEYRTGPRSSGRPAPGYQVAILDEDGEPLPAGRTGEIVARSNLRHGFFLGYWNNPEKTKETLSGEWLRSGDMGYIQEDGSLVYLQRIADLARRRGRRVAPFQAEERILEHDGVQEVAVIGLQDDPDHETLVALIIVAASRRGDDPDELAESIRAAWVGELPEELVPDHLMITESFPKDILGKLDRKRLRQDVRARIAPGATEGS
jgi:carnitine-CoA ligase